jgi:heptosyltransferase-1
VLIIKPSALGDVVTGMPVLRALKRSHPSARVSWLVSTRCAALIAHDSQLDEVVLFDRRGLGGAWRSPVAAGALAKFLWRLRASRYDWVIDLQGLARSGIFAGVCRAPVRAGFADAREGAALFYNRTTRPDEPHTVDRNIALARELGLDARPEDMTLQVSPGGASFVEDFCRREGLRRGGFVVCSAPTTWPTKLYPLRHWRTVVRELAGATPVVLVGAPRDRELCSQIAEDQPGRVIDLGGRTTVDQMVAVIAASAGVVCCDSGAKFIAPAVGVDCVALLGPTRHANTGPYLRGSALVADVPCRGCLKKRCPHITCMQTIDPGEVISAVKAMLRE